MFHSYLIRWNLVADGDPIITTTSCLLPVLYKQMPAILKIAKKEQEILGNSLVRWWEGHGVPHVYLHEDDAMLMERATDTHALQRMVQEGNDSASTAIICEVAKRLHTFQKPPLPNLISLHEYFEPLRAIATNGVLLKASTIATELLAQPEGDVVLHGDLHHENVLNFGERGWLAIDPKFVHGDPAFDYANIFCNPDIYIATAANRLSTQVKVVCAHTNLSELRLLKWIMAYAGLSAAWFISEGHKADLPLQIAEIVAAELASQFAF